MEVLILREKLSILAKLSSPHFAHKLLTLVGDGMSDSTHKIILFSETDYKGKALVIFGEIQNLFEVLKDWNDKAQSVIVVKGHWKLKAGPNYSGENGVDFFCDGPENGFYRFLPDTLNKGVTSLSPI